MRVTDVNLADGIALNQFLIEIDMAEADRMLSRIFRTSRG